MRLDTAHAAARARQWSVVSVNVSTALNTVRRQPYGIVVGSLISGIAALVVSALQISDGARLFTFLYVVGASATIVILGLWSSRRTLAYGLPLLLAAPIFIRIGGPGLIGLPETSSARVGGQTLPIGALTCLLVYGRMLAGQLRTERPSGRVRLAVFIYAFSAISGIGILYGLLRWQSPLTLLYGVQTVAPLAGYFVARHLVRSEAELLRTWYCVVSGASASAMVLIGNELLQRPFVRLFDSAIHGKVGMLNIYQANDYLPLLWAFIFIGSIPLLAETWSPALAIGLALIATSVGGLYARGALLFLVVGLPAALASSPHLWVTRRRVLVLVLAAVVVGMALAISPAGVRMRERVEVVVGARSLRAAPEEMSVRDRVFSMRVVADYVGAHPTFGAAFTPPPAHELSRRIAVLPTRQLFPAHNQYLDIAFRGGLPLLAAFIVMIVIALFHCFRCSAAASSRAARSLARGLAISMTLTVIVANMYQQNYIQPLTAFLLWYVVGAVDVLDTHNSASSTTSHLG